MLCSYYIILYYITLLYYTVLYYVVVEWLTLLLDIWDVLRPNIGPEIGYPEVICAFLSPSKKISE
jgi:hypothetical protein